jgi:hypothetical protein
VVHDEPVEWLGHLLLSAHEAEDDRVIVGWQ